MVSCDTLIAEAVVSGDGRFFLEADTMRLQIAPKLHDKWVFDRSNNLYFNVQKHLVEHL